MRQKKSQPRVFLGLFEIASYYSGLKQGFDELGIDSVFVELGRNKLTREVKSNPRHWILSLVHDVALMGEIDFRSHYFLKAFRGLVLPVVKALLLLWAICRYDVFVFGFATSFFGFKELPLLRLLGKKIIYVFHGSDSRPPYISGNFIYSENPASIVECVAATKRQKRIVTTIERQAHLCINHPPQGHFHERKFINHCFIGHPCKLASSPTLETKSETSEFIRIVHAPSNPKPKGTDTVRVLIAKLKAAGLPIKYTELINRPNHEVLDELARCDFVIDELYSDIPLAGLGTEAAFFGKPAVVGGYAQAELNRYALQAGLPMQLYVLPDEVEATVKRLMNEKSLREEHGAVAQRFVTATWAPREVALRFLRLISGDIPAEWWYDPSSNQYLNGWGAPEEQTQSYVRRMIDEAGKSALQLADKPGLEQAFVDFAQSTEKTFENN